MRKLTISLLASSLLLAGCVTDPNTGERRVNKAGIGALAGAAAGALIAKSNADKDKMGQAAVIGAALGGGIGYYMDRQEAALREQTAGTGIDVQKDPATGALNLVMPGSITFAFDSANIAPQFMGTLNDVAGVLAQYDKTSITVEGHTDNVGSASYNQVLSQQRASAVSNYLMSRNVSPVRINSMGLGMNQPVASNATDAGRQQNRRVEIRINPPASLQ